MTLRCLLPTLSCMLLLAGCAPKETEESTRETESSIETPVVANLKPGAAAADKVVILNDSNFQAEIGAGLVLVDFWATWCGPCQYQGPIVEELAGQVQGVAKVAKLDVDKAPVTANRYGIQSIPTLMLFKDGAPVQQFVGVQKAKVLRAAIDAAK